MSEAAAELRDIVGMLRSASSRLAEPSVEDVLRLLEDASAEVARAWSGSSLGYHSCVYYANLEPPPPGAHFSQEWGFLGQFQGTTGQWREYPYEAVLEHIFEVAGNPDLTAAETLAEEVYDAVERAKASINSILTTALTGGADTYLSKLKDRVENTAVLTARRATELQIATGAVMTRDTTAAGQGLRAAPHQAALGRVVGCRSPGTAAKELADMADQGAEHLERTERRSRREEARMAGSFVFIGHGRSDAWRELKDFVTDRLGLKCDEFNRVPVAGVTNVERLVQMLDDAAIALLVSTAEDETADGKVLARQNVVHEAGLFQGRLGFTRAIVLLEDGCEEFSNINGLGQIRFPHGKIRAAFEDVRHVFEREGLL